MEKAQKIKTYVLLHVLMLIFSRLRFVLSWLGSSLS